MSLTPLLRAATSAVVAAAALLGLAGTASAAPRSPLIGYGHSTNTHAVWCVQHQLNYALRNVAWGGPVIPAVAEDGKWGPETVKAVKWFQEQLSFTKDGIVGPQTGTRLLADGDPRYSGDAFGVPSDAYCYGYLPSSY